VAGDESGGVQPRALVALALQESEPQDRLDTGEKYPSALEGVFVVQGDLGEGGGVDGGVHRSAPSDAASIPFRPQRGGWFAHRAARCAAPPAACPSKARGRKIPPGNR